MGNKEKEKEMKKKIFVLAQIIFLLGVFALILYREYRPAAPLDYHPKTWRSRRGFLAISYSDISNKGKNHISRKQLYSHLTILQRSGYKTITPEDIVNFYEKKSPLPQKAIFIMFEENRKESYLYARSMLKNLGMLASMCVPTSLMRRRGGVFLKEKELTKLVKDPRWSLCSMGDSAIKGISIDSKGTIDHFLSHLMWKDGKLEDEFSFKYRIFEDYKKSAEILNRIYKPVGRKVVAYLYPYSDPGTGFGAYPKAEDINKEALKKFYKIAFISANNPLNVTGSNLYALTRLRIPSNWDAERLIKELDKFSPRSQFYQIVSDKKDWIKKGKIKTTGFLLTPNANIWLRGSDNWADMKGDVKFILMDDASFVIFLRYTSNKSFFSISIDKVGIYVREKIENSYQTLFRYPLKEEKETFHNIKFILKGKRAWVWHNGKLISDALPVSSNTVKGRIGFLAQKSDVKFLDFKASQIPKVFAFVNSYKELTPEAQKIVTGIIPTWYNGKIGNDFLGNLGTNKGEQIYEIYIGTYTKKVEAEALKKYLNKLFFNTIERKLSDKKDSPYFEVSVGPYSSFTKAKKELEIIKKKGFNAFIKSFIRENNNSLSSNINEDDLIGLDCSYIVKIKGFKSEKRANSLLKELKKEGLNVKIKKQKNKAYMIYSENLKDRNLTERYLRILENLQYIKKNNIFIDKKCAKRKNNKKIFLPSGSFVLKIGEYSEPAEAEALYEFLKNKGFVCFEKEIQYSENSEIVHGVFVGPFSNIDNLLKAKKELSKMGINSTINPIFIKEEREIEILKAASVGISTIPLLQLNTNMNKKSAENFVIALISELKYPAIRLLLKYFALYGKESELHKAFHKYGFNILRIVTPQEAMELARKRWTLGDDIILIYGKTLDVKRAYNSIVANIPEDRILILTVGKIDGIKGLKIAIKGTKE